MHIGSPLVCICIRLTFSMLIRNHNVLSRELHHKSVLVWLCSETVCSGRLGVEVKNTHTHFHGPAFVLSFLFFSLLLLVCPSLSVFKPNRVLHLVSPSVCDTNYCQQAQAVVQNMWLQAPRRYGCVPESLVLDHVIWVEMGELRSWCHWRGNNKMIWKARTLAHINTNLFPYRACGRAYKHTCTRWHGCKRCAHSSYWQADEILCQLPEASSPSSGWPRQTAMTQLLLCLLHNHFHNGTV